MSDQPLLGNYLLFLFFVLKFKILDYDANMQSPDDIQIPPNSPKNNDNIFKNVKSLLNDFSSLQYEMLDSIPIKKRKLFKNKLLDIKEKHSEIWMEIEDSYNLDQLFNDNVIVNKKFLLNDDEIKINNVFRFLKESIVPGSTLNKSTTKESIFDYKEVNYLNLDEAKIIIEKIYHLDYVNDKRNKKNSIQSALILGLHLSKIQSLCKEKKRDPNIPREEKIIYQLMNYIKTCKIFDWSKSYIYFLIDFYELSEKYLKLKKITVTLDFLKNNMKFIKKGLKQTHHQKNWK